MALPRPPQFVNVAKERGVEFVHVNDARPERFFLPEVMGGGVAWFDFDGDGLLDLIFANGGCLDDSRDECAVSRDALYWNRGSGPMTDATSRSGCIDCQYGQGIAVGDFDHDGFADLYFANYGPDVLLHNNGDGTFSDETATAHVTDDDWSSSAAWFDANQDGWLDLYVTNYMDVTLKNHKVCKYNGKPGYCGPGSFAAVDDRLYVSRGDGSFEERAAELGVIAPNGKGLAVAVLDLNDDLLPEVYVANDMTPNFLFSRSRDATGGSATFRNVADIAGCATSGSGENEASMGIACGDFDRDGRIDLLLTHYFQAKNTLYRNLGDLVFVDDSRRWRVAATSWDYLGFGVIPLDYNLDGLLDLFVTNGHVLGPLQEPNEMTPQLLHNTGQWFDDVSSQSGEFFHLPNLGRGAAGGDFDNDGDLDIAISHVGRLAAVLQNQTERTHHFVGFELRTRNRLPPVGGRLMVKTGKQTQVAAVISGGSYLSASDPRLIFGLGDGSEPVDVEIHWPSGRVDDFESVGIDEYWWIMEGDSIREHPHLQN